VRDFLLIYFDETGFLIGMGILGVLLSLLWRRKHSLSYLLFFSIFWVYLLVVVQSVIFPIYINLDRSDFSPSINLVPLYFGDCSIPELCVRGILENMILTVPFGFGINFLVRVSQSRIPWLALAVGLGFELSQLVLSLVGRSGFRAVDINDALLNAAGVLLGYALFRGFGWIYVKAVERLAITPRGLFAAVYEVVSIHE
jgi:glycopeptide antibiotics resistance protein